MSVQQVRRFGIVAGIALCIGLMALLATTVSFTAPAPASPEPQPVPGSPSQQQVRVALHRAGLTPERLAAASVASNQVALLVQRTIEHLAGHTGPGALDVAAGEAQHEVRRLEHLVRSGQSTAEDFASLAAARATLTNAIASREAGLGALFEAASADLTQPQRQLLAAIAGNERWAMPVEFLTIAMSESQRIALRDALTNERIAAKKGEDSDAAAAALLQEIRGNPTVALARAQLDSNLAVVQSAWEQAVAQMGGTP